MKKSFDLSYVLSLALLLGVLAFVIFLACVPNARSRVLHKDDESAEATPVAAVAAPKPTLPPEQVKALHIFFPDVGQGDCALLCSPNGYTMLIDSGEADAAANVLALLEKQGIKKLDIVIASHMHSDHAGAMPAVVYSHEVGVFVMPTSAQTDPALSAALKDRDIPIIKADSETKLEWDPDIKPELLSPLPGISYRDENQGSIIMRLQYGGTSILFTGDAGYQAEELALAAHDISAFRADVLKLGHHGSSDATTPRFLHAVAPSIGIICCGMNNSYGHPHQSVLNQLSQRKIQAFRTDLDGELHIVMDGKEVYIESAH